MKKILIIISILFISGCTTQSEVEMLGAKQMKVDSMKIEQALHKESNGKYKRMGKTLIGDEEVSVTEYVTPSGEAGYQILHYKNGQAYKSEGFGPEAKERTWEREITDSIPMPEIIPEIVVEEPRQIEKVEIIEDNLINATSTYEIIE